MALLDTRPPPVYEPQHDPRYDPQYDPQYNYFYENSSANELTTIHERGEHGRGLTPPSASSDEGSPSRQIRPLTAIARVPFNSDSRSPSPETPEKRYRDRRTYRPLDQQHVPMSLDVVRQLIAEESAKRVQVENSIQNHISKVEEQLAMQMGIRDSAQDGLSRQLGDLVNGGRQASAQHLQLMKTCADIREAFDQNKEYLMKYEGKVDMRLNDLDIITDQVSSARLNQLDTRFDSLDRTWRVEIAEVRGVQRGYDAAAQALARTVEEKIVVGMKEAEEANTLVMSKVRKCEMMTRSLQNDSEELKTAQAQLPVSSFRRVEETVNEVKTVLADQVEQNLSLRQKVHSAQSRAETSTMDAIKVVEKRVKKAEDLAANEQRARESNTKSLKAFEDRQLEIIDHVHTVEKKAKTLDNEAVNKREIREVESKFKDYKDAMGQDLVRLGEQMLRETEERREQRNQITDLVEHHRLQMLESHRQLDTRYIIAEENVRASAAKVQENVRASVLIAEETHRSVQNANSAAKVAKAFQFTMTELEAKWQKNFVDLESKAEENKNRNRDTVSKMKKVVEELWEGIEDESQERQKDGKTFRSLRDDVHERLHKVVVRMDAMHKELADECGKINQNFVGAEESVERQSIEISAALGEVQVEFDAHKEIHDKLKQAVKDEVKEREKAMETAEQGIVELSIEIGSLQSQIDTCMDEMLPQGENLARLA